MRVRLSRHTTSFLITGLALVIGLALTCQSVEAQELETDLAGLALENAQRYVEPVTFGLGYAMSGGFFDNPGSLRRFGFEFGARVMGALPSDASKTFDVILPDEIVYNGQTFQNPYQVRGGDPATPTASGSGPGVVLEPRAVFAAYLLSQGEDPEDYTIQFPEGADLPAIPFLVAHATMGIGWGTEVAVRMIPEVEIDEEVGGMSSYGFGIKHSVSQWFPGPSPVDLSVWYGRQNLKVGDFLEGSSNQYGLMVGRGFGPLTLYGTGMMRNASVDVTYTVENPDDNPALPPDGEELGFSSDLDSRMVVGLGARLKLLILNLSAQYTADEYSTLSLKVGLGFP